MLYESNTDLPDPVRNALPDAAQTIYRKAFNTAIEDEPDEAKAIRVGWAAVKKKYAEKDGKWVKLELLAGKLHIAEAYANYQS